MGGQSKSGVGNSPVGFISIQIILGILSSMTDSRYGHLQRKKQSDNIRVGTVTIQRDCDTIKTSCLEWRKKTKIHSLIYSIDKIDMRSRENYIIHKLFVDTKNRLTLNHDELLVNLPIEFSKEYYYDWVGAWKITYMYASLLAKILRHTDPMYIWENYGVSLSGDHLWSYSTKLFPLQNSINNHINCLMKLRSISKILANNSHVKGL